MIPVIFLERKGSKIPKSYYNTTNSEFVLDHSFQKSLHKFWKTKATILLKRNTNDILEGIPFKNTNNISGETPIISERYINNFPRKIRENIYCILLVCRKSKFWKKLNQLGMCKFKNILTFGTSLTMYLCIFLLEIVICVYMWLKKLYNTHNVKSINQPKNNPVSMLFSPNDLKLCNQNCIFLFLLTASSHLLLTQLGSPFNIYFKIIHSYN